MKHRLNQVESELTEKIALILRREVADPRIGLVTVTGVRATPDLQKAIVNVGILGSPFDRAEALKRLQKAAGFVQRHLGQQIHLKRTPHLVFELDDTAEKAVEMSRIIDQALKEPGE